MRILLCALSLFVMWSCSQPAGSEFVASADMADEPTVVAVSQTTPDKPVPERKLIRNGSMSFEVKDAMAARRSIVAFASEIDGYITSEKLLNNNDDHTHFEQVIRVPGNKLDDFISRIDTIASRVDSRDFSSQDVTEEYVDLESRLRAKRDVEARYREITKQAKTTEELMIVEQQVGEIRSEIEKIEGRIKYLSNKAAFSTVTLNYYEHYSEVVPGLGSKFAVSFTDGWDGLMVFLVALARTWPFLLIAGPVTWFILRRKRKEHKPLIQPQ